MDLRSRVFLPGSCNYVGIFIEKMMHPGTQNLFQLPEWAGGKGALMGNTGYFAVTKFRLQ